MGTPILETNNTQGHFLVIASTGQDVGDLLTGTAPEGGPLVTTNATNSTTSQTGAIIQNGGTAATSVAFGQGNGNIGGTLAVTGQVTLSTATPATSISTGELQNAGGYAAARASFLRGVSASGDANAALVSFFSNQSVDPAAYRTAVAVTNNNGGATAGNTGVTAAFTGSVGNSIAGVTLADVRGFEANIDTTNATSANTLATGFYFKNGTNTGTTATKVGFQCEALTGTAVFAFRSAGAGVVSIGDPTAATASTTASVTTAGGYGAVKPSYFGTIGASFTGNILAGVQSGAAAVAGQVGEVITSTVSAAAAGATGVTANVTSIALTAGDWLVMGQVVISGGATGLTASSLAQLSITTTTGGTGTNGSTLSQLSIPALVANGFTPMSVPFTRINISAGATYFLTCQVAYASGSPTIAGTVTATRMR